MDVSQDDETERATMVDPQATPQPDVPRQDDPEGLHDNQQLKKMDIDHGSPTAELLSPVSIEDKAEEKEGGQPVVMSNYISSSSSMNYEFSNVRVGFK